MSTDELSPSERYAGYTKHQGHPVVHDFCALYDFPLDDFQLRACREIEDGRGVLVAAPTGSGKTVVGEFAIHLALAHGPQVLLHDADQGAVATRSTTTSSTATAPTRSGC